MLFWILVAIGVYLYGMAFTMSIFCFWEDEYGRPRNMIIEFNEVFFTIWPVILAWPLTLVSMLALYVYSAYNALLDD